MFNLRKEDRQNKSSEGISMDSILNRVESWFAAGKGIFVDPRLAELEARQAASFKRIDQLEAEHRIRYDQMEKQVKESDELIEASRKLRLGTK